jgi:acetylornithine deacetylase
MDGTTLLETTRSLVEAPSPSGEEGPALLVAEALFQRVGLEVERQVVGENGRWNLLARSGRPRSVLVTHIDTVPGNPPVRREGDTLYGRGACDAKGILASMAGAASALRNKGRTDFGVLAVVGEETTSDGALRADRAFATGEIDWPVERVLIGEPTGNRWVSAHPGVLILTIRAKGRSAHSAYPEEGESALHLLLDFLDELRRDTWPSDPVLGETRLNIGAIRGGEAANVVAPEAEAQIMMRSGAEPSELEARIRELAGDRYSLNVTCSSAPVKFSVPAKSRHEAQPVAFSTDAPFLRSLGDRYLLGPGSIRDAHTDVERITGSELEAARDIYADWVEASDG